jgi:hypothetical protein
MSSRSPSKRIDNRGVLTKTGPTYLELTKQTISNCRSTNLKILSKTKVVKNGLTLRTTILLELLFQTEKKMMEPFLSFFRSPLNQNI